MIGVALLIFASTLAVFLTMRVSSGDAEAENAQRSESSSRIEPTPSPRSHPSRSSKGEVPQAVFTVSVPADHPRRDELIIAAREVEEEANDNLAQLSRQLDLSAVQRERLFPILARSSDSYDPSFIVAGTVPGTSALVGEAGKEAVHKVLDPEQQDQLMEEEMNNIILWQEIIDTLEKRLEEEAPRVPAPGALPPRQRSNLQDLLNSQPDAE